MAEPPEGRGHTSGWRRLLGRIAGSAAVVGLAAGAVLVLQDVATDVAKRPVEEALDQAESIVDAARFRVDLTYPGSACAYGGVAGWGSPDVEDGDRESYARLLESGAAIDEFGDVRLHFTLPTTSELTSIDVRGIQPRVSPSQAGQPDWRILTTGCGGEQYSRDYRVVIRDEDVATSQLLDDGTESSEPFEPFTVDPGETVFLDYEVLLCSSATVDVAYDVSFVTGSGEEQSVTLPADTPIRVTSQASPRAFYFGPGGALEEYGEALGLGGRSSHLCDRQ